MDFQNSVNVNPAKAIPGDFASSNPRASALAPTQRGLYAGADGVTIGDFGWIDELGQVFSHFALCSNNRPGQIAFVGRQNEAVGTNSMTISPSKSLTAYSGGDFWGTFPLGCQINDRVFAGYGSGHPLAGTDFDPPINGIYSGSITGNVLTVSKVLIGNAIVLGEDIINIPQGDIYIWKFGTGKGAEGTYILSRSVNTPIAEQQFSLIRGRWTTFVTTSACSPGGIATFSSSMAAFPYGSYLYAPMLGHSEAFLNSGKTIEGGIL